MLLPDLFQDVVDPTVKVGDRSFYSLPVSVLLHGVGVIAVVALALTATDMLPAVPTMMAFVAPIAAAPAPPPPPPPATAAPSRPAPAASPAAAPIAAPAEIRPETGLETDQAGGVAGGVEGGIPEGLAGGIVGGLPEAAPPMVAATPSKVPIRVGGAIRAPNKIRHVEPVYPALAVHARVQGMVIIEAVIDVDGSVTDTRVLRSVPLLDQAAIEAVQQWKYTTTLLNGLPTPAVLVVTVNFQLGAVRGVKPS